MRSAGPLAVGCFLILVAIVGATKGYRDHRPAPSAEFAWGPSQAGHLTFVLLLESKAWHLIAEQSGNDWIGPLHNEAVHERINALIEQAMRGDRQGCPRRWLMARIAPLQDGSVLFGGYCASQAELRAAHRVDGLLTWLDLIFDGNPHCGSRRGPWVGMKVMVLLRAHGNRAVYSSDL